MHKENAIHLRLALSAAAVCAVLTAATASGARGAGPPSIAMDAETATVFVNSISTIRKPSVERDRASQERFATPLDDARLLGALVMHKGE